MRVDTLPNGARGFDANSVITATIANNAVAAGYRFAIRYVRRRRANPHDITLTEVDTILRHGLGLMLVQHFSGEGWVPSAALGAEYGANAVDHAQVVGYPMGATLWNDLESVKKGTKHAETIAHCNAWYDAVKAAGYVPGLYVGYACGLTARELYERLKFQRYWSAYNLNRDEYPVERGVCMRQLVAKDADLIAPLNTQTMDVDVIGADAKGGTPTLAFA